MLNEIINSIGFDNLLDDILINTKREDSIYIKVNHNTFKLTSLIVDSEVKKKNILINPLSDEDYYLFKWFNTREKLSVWISSNKAIDSSKPYTKKITSSNKYSIIFKYSNFKRDFNNNPMLNIRYAIKKYLEILGATYLEKAYLKALDYIIENFSEEDLIKRKIKIFIDKDLDAFKILNKTYLEKYLANNVKDKFLQEYLEINDEIIYTGFSVIGNKFLLGNTSMSIKELGITSKENAFKQEILKRYLESKQEVKLNIDDFELIKDFKEKYLIKDFKYIDYSKKDIFSNKPLIINYEEISKKSDDIFSERIISSREEFKKFLFYFLGKGVEKYTLLIDRLVTNSDINSFLRKLNEIYVTIEQASKNNYLRFYKLIQFEIACEDYFNNKNLSMEFDNMYEKFSKKLSKYNDMDFNNSKEMSYVLGQLIRYTRNNFKNKSDFNFLKPYLYNYTTKHIFKLLNTDMKKFKSNQRTLNVLSEIIDYIELFNIKKVDELAFKKGLFDSNNIFYVKGELKSE
ncbi:hypothetical protein [Clostridium perfringens]|uniref:hypothetical protein n=1 Tax=Clostridium perfringens TaxID=1502 RepID=UPI003CF0AEC7